MNEPEYYSLRDKDGERWVAFRYHLGRWEIRFANGEEITGPYANETARLYMNEYDLNETNKQTWDNIGVGLGDLFSAE